MLQCLVFICLGSKFGSVSRGLEFRQKRCDEVHRQGENDGSVLVGANDRERFQIAQKYCLGFLSQYFCRLKKFFSCLQFSFGVNHLGPPFPLCLGLPGDGTDHGFRQV